MDFLRLARTNKAFPFPIIFSVLPSLLRFLLFSSLLFSSSFVFASVSNSKASSIQQQCIEDHFSALLDLKQGFYFNGRSKTRLSSWIPVNRDCCSWEGINCDAATGHVIGLNISSLQISGQVDFVSIFRLQSLRRLNLAFNKFDPSPIPSGFELLTSLTHLNLSRLNLYGQIPLEISRLTTLVSLDLSSNYYFNGSDVEYLKLENPSIRELFQNLSRLTELHLDDVKISVQGSDWGLVLSSSLPHLRKLSLSYCGLSGPIQSSLSRLSFLSELDLSRNNLSSVVPNFIGNFSSLTSLDLSGCGLYGKIPESIFRLPNLQTLYVGHNPLLTSEIPQNNTLRQLSLSNTGFCSKLQDSLGNLKLLTMLRLRDCKISGALPSWLMKLDKLVYLDLSYNDFSGPLPSSIANLSNLVHLYLFSNGFSGPLPSSLGNLSNLVTLDLAFNGLSGPLPSSLANLSNLVTLDLSFNGLSGPLPSSYGNKFQNLERLDADSNSLSGTIPSSLFSLPSLQTLLLSKNQFSGQLEELQNASSSLLRTIVLGGNNLQGPIPKSFFKLTKLEYLTLNSNNFSGPITSLYGNELQKFFYLDLSNNSLSGTIPSSLFSLPSLQYLSLSSNQFSGPLGEFHNASSSRLVVVYLGNNKLQGTVHLGLFQNLTMLSSLSLSDNNFSVGGSNSTFLSFPQFKYLSLRSCNIRNFPDILRNQERIQYLDLSNNRINGKIPYWIWKVGNGSLISLKLSHNALEGLEQPSSHLSLSSLEYLDLSFNKLEGSIPIPPPSTTFYLLSSNNFSGEVPSLICNCTSLQVLDMSNNCFNGSIPPCLGEISDALIVLNLKGNAFHGTLHQTFKEGCTLETFDLNGNRLEGQVPRSLEKCKMLEVLNLGRNQIRDTFPFWLENLSQLRILVLRSNKFHGTIRQHPLINHTFPLLQIFDISSNSFTGNLPSNMFRSWKAMMEEGKSQSQFLNKSIGGGYYQDKVTIVSKGLQMELVKILIAFTVVDLSNNQFHSDIPELVGDLKSLHVLNMSYNSLTGRIPKSLGNIKDLESLDLSQNNLSGEIPEQLTKLTFLAVLNLSQNHLIGSIPQSQQFLTFTNESFQGNFGLCGPPLSRKCGDNKVLLPSIQSEIKYDWRSMWIGFGVGYGVGMGILFWTLALWTNGKRKYILFIDKMLLLIFPCEALSLMHRN